MKTLKTKQLTLGKTFVAGGVCAGLAEYYQVNKGGLQAVFLLSSLFYGWPALLYLALWVLIPNA